MKMTFDQLIGGIIGLVAVAAVVYASIVQYNEGATTALVGLVGTAAGYFLRAKLDIPK